MSQLGPQLTPMLMIPSLNPNSKLSFSIYFIYENSTLKWYNYITIYKTHINPTVGHGVAAADK